jgi:hypothetical protein
MGERESDMLMSGGKTIEPAVMRMMCVMGVHPLFQGLHNRKAKAKIAARMLLEHAVVVVFNGGED